MQGYAAEAEAAVAHVDEVAPQAVVLPYPAFFPARRPRSAGESQDRANGRFDQPVRYVDEPSLRQSELISGNIGFSTSGDTS